MKKQLAEVLINKGIMRPGTLLYGPAPTVGLGPNVQLIPLELMMEEFDGETFLCRDRLGKSYTMNVKDVQEVDGMEPARLASVYNIRADGGNKKVGKKRGRKPKTAHINTIEGDLNGKDKRTSNNNQVESAS